MLPPADEYRGRTAGDAPSAGRKAEQGSGEPQGATGLDDRDAAAIHNFLHGIHAVQHQGGGTGDGDGLVAHAHGDLCSYSDLHRTRVWLLTGHDDNAVLVRILKSALKFLVSIDLSTLGNLRLCGIFILTLAGLLSGLCRHGVEGVAVCVCVRNQCIPLRSRGGQNIIVVARNHGHGAVEVFDYVGVLELKTVDIAGLL